MNPKIKKAEVRETFDGKERVCWPSIVTYRLKDGSHTNYVPMDGQAFEYVVKDLPLFEELNSSGLIRQEAHTGRPSHSGLIDRRSATQ